MVFFGYNLPKRNESIRLQNLKIALENDQVKLLYNTSLSVPREVINSLKPVQVPAVEQSVPVVTQTPTTPKPPPPSPSQAIPTENKVLHHDLRSLKTTPSNSLLTELINKVNSPDLGLHGKKNIVLPAIPTVNISELSDDDKKEIEKFVTELDTIKTEDDIKIFISQHKDKKIAGKWINLPYLTQKSNVKYANIHNKLTKWIQTSIFNFLHTSKDSFIDYFKTDFMREVKGGSLVKAGDRLRSKSSANFGSLFLNEKKLKNNELVISRPYSNINEIRVKKISPLLKK